MDQKFRIGLTMAGAVSAGAYTGGVLDYLFQVLDAWHEAKRGNDDSIPGHSISLDIISGASAGGITGAMAALDLHLEKRYPAIPARRDDRDYLSKNIFYHSWVNLLQDDMIPLLLARDDIGTNGRVVSLLNSDFIPRLAERSLVCVPDCITAPPDWVNPAMELVLTLSNLDGFSYELRFAGEGASVHRMRQHRDYAFFRLGREYGHDGRIPLSFFGSGAGLEELRQAAQATGAFPVGLAYRRFSRKNKYILDNHFLVKQKREISSVAGMSGEDPEADYITYNVDGGMLNNEPFDLSMKLMAAMAPGGGAREFQSEDDFDSTLIMIDPFPSDDSITGNGHPEAPGPGEKPTGEFPYDLPDIMGRIYRSMRGELLFKGDEIIEAFSGDNFSRFMIAPRRRKKFRVNGAEHEEIYNGSVAIACGALDGFAGFFHRSFREHDFYLGRANCQGFLRRHFRVRLDENQRPVNRLFASGYSPAAVARFRFQDENERKALVAGGGSADDAPWYVPVIPDMNRHDPAFDEIPPAYPVYDLREFDRHREMLQSRMKAVAGALLPSPALRGLFSAYFLFRKNAIYRKLRGKLEKEFGKWGLTG